MKNYLIASAALALVAVPAQAPEPGDAPPGVRIRPVGDLDCPHPAAE